ncbi:hypothetical protein Egran_02500 [Elaphomyces granulatus]|uniref:Nitrogen permease regulator 3 n=1 Tax=Elaphomyces granulatus TaxID=519963 RepID=A0A232M041_9EURO|nr:hypothetical protein Egran_02500 [Elaphomyces granulatus]
MSFSAAKFSEPCLVAIILTVHSRAGPRFVFHFPPNPLSENAYGVGSHRSSRAKVLIGSDSASSGESGDSSDEDDEGSHFGAGARHNNSGLEDNVPASASSTGGESHRPPSLSSSRNLMKKRAANSDVEDDQGSSSRRKNASVGSSDPWDTLLGLPSDVWEKLLSPTRTWHKRRFEVAINDLAFVGWPVFVRDDGTWRKQKRRKKKKPSPGWGGAELGYEEDIANTPSQEDDTDKMVGSVLRIKTEALRDGRLDTEIGGSGSKGHSGSPDSDKDSMTMFNVVFVLDSPILEYSLRLKEIYENVIKKFSKALKWEQARADYVWNEAQNILQIKEKAREKKASMNSLYSELIAQSSLARAISTVFTSISTSKIASVSLGPDASISLQIPPPTSTPYLPSPTDAAYPGLWLTTADESSPADDAAAGGIDPHSETLAKHFALLLLDNEAAILRDVEASGGALGPALAHYIRTTKPNKSFTQISALSGIPLSNIQLLASHLVYWRRARAIPPLHQRDTYIVSPNCDLSKLPAATAAYAATFPTLPSLPKMLSALSGTPRPYASFIPSKDHKAAYFSILAWLLRGGWVTQLRAFARIKVPPETKIAADQSLQQEEIEKLMVENRASFKSPTNRHVQDDNCPSPSSLGSHGSDQETIIPGQRESLSQYYMNRNAHLRTSSLILLPHRASPVESRWLDEIMARFPDPASPERVKGITSMDEPAEPGIHDSLKKYWPKFTKYFNGHDALEKIAAREGLKRKTVWQLLMRMGMITGQNLGIELDPKEKVLIAVRHW